MMTRYVLRRLLQAIPVLFMVSVLVFSLIQVAPNNPLAVYQNNPDISSEDLQWLADQYGLNDPVLATNVIRAQRYDLDELKPPAGHRGATPSRPETP